MTICASKFCYNKTQSHQKAFCKECKPGQIPKKDRVARPNYEAFSGASRLKLTNSKWHRPGWVG